jgi:gentisate 1,2-dioxygenase
MSGVDAVEIDEPTRLLPTLDALYHEAERLNLTPGWIPRHKPILWPKPRSAFAPAHWSYREAKASLEAAGA